MTEPYDDLIAALDLPGKVRLLTGASFFGFNGAEPIGLTPLSMSDGPTGVKGHSQSGGDPTALLPNPTLLAASWSESALTEVGSYLADEAIRQHIHVVVNEEGPPAMWTTRVTVGRMF